MADEKFNQENNLFNNNNPNNNKINIRTNNPKSNLNNNQFNANKNILQNVNSKQSNLNENIKKELMGANQTNKNTQNSRIYQKEATKNKQDYQAEDTNFYYDNYNDPNYYQEEDEIIEEKYGGQLRNRSLRVKGKKESADSLKEEKSNKKPLKITIQGGKIAYEQINNNSMMEWNSSKNLINKQNLEGNINNDNNQEEFHVKRNLIKKQINNKRINSVMEDNNDFASENNKAIKAKRLLKGKQANDAAGDLSKDSENPIKLKFDMNKCNLKFIKFYHEKIF
jgi:hypothetical protein